MLCMSLQLHEIFFRHNRLQEFFFRQVSLAGIFFWVKVTPPPAMSNGPSLNSFTKPPRVASAACRLLLALYKKLMISMKFNK